MSDKTAPFLIAGAARNYMTGSAAMMHGITFARSQAEALGKAISDYRQRYRAEDGFAEPTAEALPLSDETCNAIYEFVAAKRKARKR